MFRKTNYLDTTKSQVRNVVKMFVVPIRKISALKKSCMLKMVKAL